MHAHRETADARGHIVTRDRALMTLRKFALRIERQRLRRDCVAVD
jgi:hypothetical protein